MDLMSLLPTARRYIDQTDLTMLPGYVPQAARQILPLAQGEYNLNYIIEQDDGRRWVLRVNIGTQIQRDDQIEYEYRALRLLETTGVTPRPYHVDDSRALLDYGVLTMEFLPGGKMDYRRDLGAAAELFARIHSHPMDEPDNHLIEEQAPLSMTYDECARLLPVYLESDLADSTLADYLASVLAWASEARHAEAYYQRDPVRAIINTEVNSGNFIANRQTDRLYLVDWEKPLWGDPSQDLSHFAAPMTTLWKTDYCMSPDDKARFIQRYRESTPNRHLANTIVERVRLRDPFNYLRGISWSAMAWVAYQSGEHAVRNEDTFRKVTAYLDIEFLRGMFDPVLARQAGSAW